MDTAGSMAKPPPRAGFRPLILQAMLLPGRAASWGLVGLAVHLEQRGTRRVCVGALERRVMAGWVPWGSIRPQLPGDGVCCGLLGDLHCELILAET